MPNPEKTKPRDEDKVFIRKDGDDNGSMTRIPQEEMPAFLKHQEERQENKRTQPTRKPGNERK